MNNESVTVFTGHGCGTCIAVKRALKAKNINFKELNVHEDEEAHYYMTHKLGLKTLPVIETDSDVWTGMDEAKMRNIK